ncbi:PadR family transcriptional regulator [Lactiplantibacillus herbarum]|uniref:PadR family transcriptional regulator n=1 Tax=Lactiplantibacillus herbarum TaxID=1670446 RepID=UPI00064E48A4|nr:PadR family transcriptional regulator [Lactiplantibacillus herbarum]
MYELLVLGALVSRDMSGYKLGLVLENSLVPRRKISNGVMYPLLNKLAEAGDISFVTDETNPRGKRFAHLTAAGYDHLHEMLLTPVAADAKRESLYRFKFKGMAKESVEVQSQILNAYKNAVLTDLQVYQQVYVHLEEKQAAAVEPQPALVWSMRTLSLQIAESETRIKWSIQQLEEINQNGTVGGMNHNE